MAASPLVPFVCDGCKRVLGHFPASSKVSHAPCKAVAKPAAPAEERRAMDCAG